MNQIISVRSAALTYQARNGEVEALRSVSFDVAEGGVRQYRRPLRLWEIHAAGRAGRA